MANLIKEHEGILYNETFQENSLIWSLTPSSVDCLRFEHDGLHILHNKNYISYTMKEPEDSYCVCMCLTHKPIASDDIGGILILSNNDNYSECQTYLAEGPSTIGNNGSNTTAGYDLSEKYVRYTFDDQTWDDDHHSMDPDDDSEYVINPMNGYKDTVYQYLKMLKYNNVSGVTYQFFASSNGKEWIEVGNVHYGHGNSIGLFLYSTDDEEVLNNGKFIVHYFSIYENQYITINGINILQEFEFIDHATNKTIFRSDTTTGINITNHFGNKVTINTQSLPIPLCNVDLRIYQKGKYSSTIAEYTLDNQIYGGDIYTIKYDIKLFIDNEEILSGEIHDIGTLYLDSFKKGIVIYNNEDFDLGNLKISIIAFSEYYNGEEVVKLAIYKGNDMDISPMSYTYKDYVIIDKLEAHTGIELVMKLSDVPEQEFYSVANKYRFKLLIE